MLDLLSCLSCSHHAVCLCAAGHAVSVDAVLLIAVGWETWLSCCTTSCISFGVVSCNDALTQSLTHPPTHSRNWSLTRSLTHSLTHSLIHSLTHSLTRSLAHSLTRSLARLLAHSLARSLILSIVYLCIQLFIGQVSSPCDSHEHLLV